MDDEDAPMICKMTGSYCVRAFCEDYGCANELEVPVDEYDVACGSDEPIPAMRVKYSREKKSSGQGTLF